ncbi:histidine phosphatase family protein [Candidatus Woesearchaeota archaeon]|nr:histidine phosphatase family protein [Candidatus Woesearchaeota archaeon]
MNNKIIFLRHAETKKDENVLVSRWILTLEGKRKSQRLVDTGIFDDVDIIIASKEIKAYQTVLPLAKRLNKKIIRIKELGEINRDQGKVMAKDEYDKLKIRIFEDLSLSVEGWETCEQALKRFERIINKINGKYSSKRILIASHGTVMTLYFANKQNKLKELMSRWKKLKFLDYGIIKDNKIIKDIN